jgi:glutamate synthase domain-containing protein 3
MSGGIAYVWDPHDVFLQHCNLGMVELERLEEAEDIAEVAELIRLHQEYTGSTVAAQLLDDWDGAVRQFVKVMPIDYRRALNEMKRATEQEPEAEPV